MNTDYGIPDYPEIVTIKTNNACNLRCAHCPRTLLVNENKLKIRSMNFDTFRLVVDDVSAARGHLRCVNDGEPLIHRDFVRQMQYIKTSELGSFSMNTNGTFLCQEKLYAILAPSPVKIIVEVSLDAFFPQTYEQIRKGATYEMVMRNIFDLLEKRKKCPDSNVRLVVSIVDHPISRGEIPLFRAFWDGLADQVIVRRYNDWNGKLQHKEGLNDSRGVPCSVPFYRTTVSYDGSIYLCIGDWELELAVGHIHEASISELWHGSRYQALRDEHISQRFSSAKICRNCKMKVLMNNSKNYLSVIQEQ